MKKVISVLMFFSICTMVSAQKNNPRLAGFETVCNQILKEWNVPGISIAVVEKGKVLFTGGFGYKDYENKKPVTENTLFAIGSCTKAFTASLLSPLLKEEKIELDKPITDYLPELKFYSNELTANVTVRDVLCHRTGLPRHDFAWYSGAFESREAMLHHIRFMEPSAPLRQTFQYNNYMYAAIAALAEKLGGKSWDELIKNQLLLPAGMPQSTTTIKDFNEATDFAYGYSGKNGKITRLKFLDKSLLPMAPAGGINASAKDMANWLLMWTNKGRVNDKEIISRDFYNQSVSSQMIVNGNLPASAVPDYYFFNYGFGWYTASYGGRYGVAHGGNINGFSAFASFFPTDSIGIYVCVNQHNSAVPRIINNIIADRLIGMPGRDWNKMLKTPALTAEANAAHNNITAKPSHALTAFSGVYKNDGYGTITIAAAANGLTGTFNRWKLSIKHRHNNYFVFTDEEGVLDESQFLKGQFMISPEGEIVSLKIPFESAVKDIEFTKQVQAPTAKVDLKQYCSDYDFNGTAVKVFLSETNVLKALVPGQPEFELIPVKQDEFNVKGAKGVSIKFERDEKGNIPAAQFIQPNGTFKVKKISADKDEMQQNGRKEDQQVASAGNDYAKYSGDYNLGGQTVKIFTRENVLMALLPGQPEYALVPGKEDEFTVKGVKGYSVKFDKDDKGRITGFLLAQPNGSMKAGKK
jgi:CubicO group peptidase (beta-lactamase class C family)